MRGRLGLWRRVALQPCVPDSRLRAVLLAKFGMRSLSEPRRGSAQLRDLRQRLPRRRFLREQRLRLVSEELRRPEAAWPFRGSRAAQS
jgi:hypothetical protein